MSKIPKHFRPSQIMVWKSNIVPITNDNDSIEEISSPKGFEDKENRNEDEKDSSTTVDARSSENYLVNDDVIEV